MNQGSLSESGKVNVKANCFTIFFYYQNSSACRVNITVFEIGSQYCAAAGKSSRRIFIRMLVCKVVCMDFIRFYFLALLQHGYLVGFSKIKVLSMHRNIDLEARITRISDCS